MKDGQRVEMRHFSSLAFIEAIAYPGTWTRFLDWRQRHVALLIIHSLLHNEVNVKMETGGSLLTSNIFLYLFCFLNA
jgi:hypothetical protein